MRATFRLEGLAATAALGERLGAALRAGDIVLLEGPLGAGKTAVVAAIARGLDSTDEVGSPTFVLVRHYRGRLPLVHADLYRLGPAAKLEVLDIEGTLAEGAALVEWGEYADLAHLGPATVLISPEGPGPDDRTLRLVDGPAHLMEAWLALVARP